MNPRFDRSRKNLSAALKNLEEAIKEKVREASLLAGSDADSEVEQQAAINKLNEEVNRLQNELSELGKEVEFLTEKNKILWQRIENFDQQKNDLVIAIEADLALIHEVIEKYDG
jgi:chromosome segregation ATPase